MRLTLAGVATDSGATTGTVSGGPDPLADRDGAAWDFVRENLPRRDQLFFSVLSTAETGADCEVTPFSLGEDASKVSGGSFVVRDAGGSCAPVGSTKVVGIEAADEGDRSFGSGSGEAARFASTVAGGRGGIDGGLSATFDPFEFPVNPPVETELVVVALGRSPSVACEGSPEKGESISTA